MVFWWLHMIIFDYFSFVFCILPKKVLLLKYQKWVSHLKNCNHYAKVVENARINFSISRYYTLLFFKKENFKFLEVALSAVLCNGPVGCIMNVWGYQRWNTANTTLDIYLLFKNGHKSTQARCKRKNIFGCLFSVHNTISLSRHEKVCLIRLLFERYFSHHRET